ncbi:hypothetical protein Tco_0290512 [Tanacetum coccineum]
MTSRWVPGPSVGGGGELQDPKDSSLDRKLISSFGIPDNFKTRPCMRIKQEGDALESWWKSHLRTQMPKGKLDISSGVKEVDLLSASVNTELYNGAQGCCYTAAETLSYCMRVEIRISGIRWIGFKNLNDRFFPGVRIRVLLVQQVKGGLLKLCSPPPLWYSCGKPQQCYNKATLGAVLLAGLLNIRVRIVPRTKQNAERGPRLSDVLSCMDWLGFHIELPLTAIAKTASIMDPSQRLKLHQMADTYYSDGKRLDVELCVRGSGGYWASMRIESNLMLQIKEAQRDYGELWAIVQNVEDGSTKMYRDLKQYFWWNGMKQDVATRLEFPVVELDIFPWNSLTWILRYYSKRHDAIWAKLKNCMVTSTSIVSDRDPKFTSHLERITESLVSFWYYYLYAWWKLRTIKVGMSRRSRQHRFRAFVFSPSEELNVLGTKASSVLVSMDRLKIFGTNWRGFRIVQALTRSADIARSQSSLSLDHLMRGYHYQPLHVASLSLLIRFSLICSLTEEPENSFWIVKRESLKQKLSF